MDFEEIGQYEHEVEEAEYYEQLEAELRPYTISCVCCHQTATATHKDLITDGWHLTRSGAICPIFNPKHIDFLLGRCSILCEPIILDKELADRARAMACPF